MYNEIHFKLEDKLLSNEVIMNNYSDEETVLQHITIFGVQNEPTSAQVNGVIFNNFFYNKTEEVSNFVMYVYCII